MSFKSIAVHLNTNLKLQLSEVSNKSVNDPICYDLKVHNTSVLLSTRSNNNRYPLHISLNIIEDVNGLKIYYDKECGCYVQAIATAVNIVLLYFSELNESVEKILVFKIVKD